jgi:hypothetical protein
MIKINTEFSRKSQEKSPEKVPKCIPRYSAEKVTLERMVSIGQTCIM